MSEPPGLLGNRSIDWQLSKRTEQPSHDRSGSRASEQLCPRDHGVEQPVATRTKLVCAAQVVDEDVRVDQDVSHGPTHVGRVA